MKDTSLSRSAHRLTGLLLTGLHPRNRRVSTWLFSSLKFQADMGLLLGFMFLVNMLGAIILLPAMARWLYPDKN